MVTFTVRAPHAHVLKRRAAPSMSHTSARPAGYAPVAGNYSHVHVAVRARPAWVFLKRGYGVVSVATFLKRSACNVGFAQAWHRLPC